jgi:hypothetical protein
LGYSYILNLTRKKGKKEKKKKKGRGFSYQWITNAEAIAIKTTHPIQSPLNIYHSVNLFQELVAYIQIIITMQRDKIHG